MSKIQYHALLWVFAVLAAQLPGFFSQPQRVAANACDQVGNALTRVWNGGNEVKPAPTPIGTYWDVRTKREEYMYPVGSYPDTSNAPAPTPDPAVYAPASSSAQSYAAPTSVAPPATAPVNSGAYVPDGTVEAPFEANAQYWGSN